MHRPETDPSDPPSPESTTSSAFRRLLWLLFIGIGVGTAAEPASAQWIPLHDLSRAGARYNDVYFVNPDVGWAVNGDGKVFGTTDGGESWDIQMHRPNAHFRSVGFLTPQRGFTGNIGIGNSIEATDPNPLYETFDGGKTWTALASFNGPTPVGLCGMYVVNDSVVVAVGRVRGPAYFARTDDGGQTWTSIDMSEYAAGLIDVYFTHPDTGFAVGLTNSDHELSRGIVLYTDDGGQTWTERYRTVETGQWCWKISFPSRRVGYVSLQRNERSPINFLKTTDGGQTWTEKLFREEDEDDDHYFVQGIGFITEEVGWIGGNSRLPAYKTEDGGETWYPVALGAQLNRFRFLSDSLGYAAGDAVHKYVVNGGSVAVERDAGSAVEPLTIHPNPSSGSVQITYALDAPAAVQLEIYDLIGRRVDVPFTGSAGSGRHAVTWSAPASGVYFCVLRANGAVRTQSVIVRHD